MKLVIAAALITVIAFLGSRLSFVRIRLPIGIENLFLTGSEYLLVGLILGASALNLLDASTLEGLYPFMGLGLSWIGMLLGVQWEFRRLSRISPRTFGIAFLQAAITMAVVGVCFFVLFRSLFPQAGPVLWIAAVTLAAAASNTTQSGLALVARTAPSASRPLMRLLRHVAGLDGMVGIVGFGFVSCLPTLHGGTPAYLWIGASLGLGVTVGLLVTALSAYRLDSDDTLLVLIGAVTFGGGLALYLNLSPLLISAVAGMVVANVARGRARAALRNVLLRGERSIYIFFLILVGANWHIGSAGTAALALACLAVRAFGKAVGGYVSARLFLPSVTPARRLGIGLLSSGGMAVAIVVNFHQIHRSELTDVVISVVLIGMLVSEIIGPALARRLAEASS